MTICSIEGCSDRVVGRGWCRKHWKRWRRNGSPEALVRRPYGEMAEHLHSLVMVPSDGCRLWTGKILPNGYGQVWLDGDWRYVHQETCTRWHGPRPKGMEVAHSCGNRSCWAGEHLRWATHTENMDDSDAHGTRRRDPATGRFLHALP